MLHILMSKPSVIDGNIVALLSPETIIFAQCEFSMLHQSMRAIAQIVNIAISLEMLYGRMAGDVLDIKEVISSSSIGALRSFEHICITSKICFTNHVIR